MKDPKILVRFKDLTGSIHWGSVDSAGSAAAKIHQLPIDFKSLGEVLSSAQHWESWLASSPHQHNLHDVDILCPVTRPARILAQGVNYADHRAEAKGEAKSKENLIFRIEDSALAPHQTPIVRPNGVELLDYEVELAIIIGKSVNQFSEITQDNLHEYAAGITVANDISARDLMIGAPFGQWYRGKSQRTFLPLGPFVHLLDDDQILDQLELKLWVNGRLRQQAQTTDLINKPLETLQDLAQWTDLEPGDVLLTGTPGGVALKAPNKTMQGLGKMLLSEEQQLSAFVRMQQTNSAYLKNGDNIESEIRSTNGRIYLGRQKNVVISQAEYRSAQVNGVNHEPARL